MPETPKPRKKRPAKSGAPRTSKKATKPARKKSAKKKTVKGTVVAPTVKVPKAPGVRATPPPPPKHTGDPHQPYVCPGETYAITRPVCIGRQERNYDRCLRCPHADRTRRPRQSDFEKSHG